MFIFSLFVASIVLWVMFIAFANSNKHLKHDHHPIIEAVIHLYSVIFFVGDVLYNVTYGSIAFMELPHYKRLTLTARLKHILITRPEDSKRYKLASFTCKKLIEPWDWNHCKLL